jgi:hypothetical protein
MLHQHRSEEALRLLQGLARDVEPAVAAIAVARLLEVDPKLVVPARDLVLASPDPKLRSLGVEVLFREPAGKHLPLLADRLNDVHPEVRLQARRSLHDLAARMELRPGVIAEGARMLATGEWRALEQATILLAQLDHKPAAGRLVELLTFDRPEVFVTAAWGLRHLAVPETLPRVLAHVEAALAGRFIPSGPDKSLHFESRDHQLSQLNQLLGKQKYATADAALRQFIPKMGKPVGPESRAAAIWALGLIHEGKTVSDLAAALEARLNDLSSIPPEDIRVAMMSAITLGRMKAKEALPSLRTHYRDRKPSPDPINNASGWAIEQITGEIMPAPEPIKKAQREWVLVPER